MLAGLKTLLPTLKRERTNVNLVESNQNMQNMIQNSYQSAQRLYLYLVIHLPLGILLF